MTVWHIEDYAVLYLLYKAGYFYHEIHPGSSWYSTDFPIRLYESIEIGDGFVIEAGSGATLTAEKKETKR